MGIHEEKGRFMSGFIGYVEDLLDLVYSGFFSFVALACAYVLLMPP